MDRGLLHFSPSFWGRALGRPRSPVAVLKRLMGMEPSVMRVDWIPRPCSSFTWGNKGLNSNPPRSA